MTKKEESKREARNGYLLDIHEISGALYHIYEALKTETDPEKKKELRKLRDTCRNNLRYYISKFMEK